MPNEWLIAGVTRIARWIAFALAVAIAAVTLTPIGFRPMTNASVDIERALAFAVLGGAIALGLPRNMIVGTLLAVAYAAILEAGQNFVPGRHGQMHDFGVKALAVVVGVVAVWLLRRVRGIHCQR